jgi:AraC-like DNA-binding protein
MRAILPEVQGTFNDHISNKEFRSLKIPFAQTSEIIADFGTIIFQHYESRDITLGHYFTMIKTPVEVQISFDRPVLMLSYILDGSVDYLDKGLTGNTLVNAGTFHLCYESPAIHPLRLGEGYMENFYIGLSEHYIESMDEADWHTKELADAIKGRFSIALHTPFYKITSRMRKVIREVMSYQGAHIDLFLKSKLPELIMLYLSSAALEAGPQVIIKDNKERLEELRSYIDDNLDKPLAVRSLASRAGLSETVLHKQFRQLFGLPIYKYILERRMLKAQQMLTSPLSHSVEKIAMECGYANKSNFVNAFKKRFGKSTNYYRQVGAVLDKNSQLN